MPLEKDITQNDYNYCLTQWKNFTTLTYQELNNLKEILKSTGKHFSLEIKEKRKGKYKCVKVFCRETGKIFESQTECANYFNVSLDAINKAVKRETKIKGLYTIAKL